MSRLAPRVDRKPIVRLVGSGISLALLIYLLSRQGWDAILAATGAIPAASLATVFLLVVVSRIAVSARWYSLLRVADRAFPFREALRLTLAGLFAANFLPTTVGGDVVRAAGVVRLARDPVGGTASIVVDRLVGMLGMFMILPVGLAQIAVWARGTAATAAPMTFALAAARIPERWLAGLAGARELVGRFAASFRIWLKQPSVLLVALGFTWVHMVCLFGEIWILLRGMGEPVSFWTIGGLWSASYFVTLIPLSINGLGLRELSVTYLFTEVGGIGLETALTLALILRALDLLMSLPGAVLIPTLKVGAGGEGRTTP